MDWDLLWKPLALSRCKRETSATDVVIFVPPEAPQKIIITDIIVIILNVWIHIISGNFPSFINDQHEHDPQMSTYDKLGSAPRIGDYGRRHWRHGPLTWPDHCDHQIGIVHCDHHYGVTIMIIFVLVIALVAWSIWSSPPSPKFWGQYLSSCRCWLFETLQATNFSLQM